MNDPKLDPTQAAYYTALAKRSGRDPLDHMPLVQRTQIAAAAADEGMDGAAYVAACLSNDPKDARIAELEAALQDVETRLGDWLTDNTEEAFEEQDVIDGIRSDVQHVLGRFD